MQPSRFPGSAARGIHPIMHLSQCALVVAVIMLVQILPSIPSWAQATPATFTNDIGMEFVQIPVGTFQMGEKASAHTVKISKSFYLGVHEVTQGQWRAVMGTAPWRGRRYVEQGDRYPAVYVSWEDAQAFIKKLNARDYESHYRLPKEAEWEYAARAGKTTAYSFGDYAWRDSLYNYAWYMDSIEGDRYAHLVGKKRKNSLGLHDLYGNVWEWVEDPYGDDSPYGASARTIRGGSWANAAGYATSAFRGYGAEWTRESHVGFRLVRENR